MSLRVWLPLNRDLRNQGLSNVAVSQNGGTFSNGAYMCYSGNHPRWTYEIEPTNKFSMAFWIKIPSTITSSNQWHTLFRFRGNDAGTDKSPYVSWVPYNQIKIWDTNEHQLLWKNLEYDTWIHIALISTFENGTYNLKMYKDGILYGEATNSNNFIIKSGTLILSGGNADNYAVGFSDFRIYDHALSKKEVAELSRGCILHYPMNDILNESTVNLVTHVTASSNKMENYENGVKVLTESGDAYCRVYFNETLLTTKTYTLSFDVKMSKSDTCSFGFYGNGAMHNIKQIVNGRNFITFTPWADLTNSLTFDDTNRSNAEPIYITNFQLEEKDHTTPYTPTGRNENLNTANWISYTSYWTIESQSLTEIKLKKNTSTTSSTVALRNDGLNSKIPRNVSITISGYLYKGDTPYKTTASVIDTYSDAWVTNTYTSRDDGYFVFTGTYIGDNTFIIHAPLFGTCQDGDICYIRNMEWHITPYLKDESGFDNHSLITGTLPLTVSPKSIRYDKSMYFNGSSCANCGTQLQWITEAISVSFWYYGSNPLRPLSCTEGGGWNFEQVSGGKVNFALYTTKNEYSAVTYSGVITDNKWHHVVGTFDGQYKKIYTDGVLSNSINLGAKYQIKYNTSADLYIGKESPAYDTTTFLIGNMSDIRIYRTALSAEAVSNLYKDSLSIDKSQNGYCYELNELDAQSSVDVKKNGQLKCKNYSEQFDGLYLPAGTYVDTLLNFVVGDTCKAETFIKYDAGGSGRDLTGFSGYAGGYWGVTANGVWESYSTFSYTDADITKYNRINWSYTCGTGDAGGNYRIGTLGNGTGYSVRNKTIYHVKLWKNGVLERDLYPCSINNQCGLIDGLTGTFYPANNSNASLVSGTVEAKMGKNGFVQANQLHEY